MNGILFHTLIAGTRNISSLTRIEPDLVVIYFVPLLL